MVITIVSRIFDNSFIRRTKKKETHGTRLPLHHVIPIYGSIFNLGSDGIRFLKVIPRLVALHRSRRRRVNNPGNLDVRCVGFNLTHLTLRIFMSLHHITGWLWECWILNPIWGGRVLGILSTPVPRSLI